MYPFPIRPIYKRHSLPADRNRVLKQRASLTLVHIVQSHSTDKPMAPWGRDIIKQTRIHIKAIIQLKQQALFSLVR